MLYQFFFFLIRVVVSVFFRRIDMVGVEHIPASGPVIFAANHPNALMDGFIIMAKCGRSPLHFMADAKLWKYPGMRVFAEGIGAVPVYIRKNPAVPINNETAFKRLYEVLDGGGCVGIFPEGVSHTDTQLVSFKTGTARIALSASDRGPRPITIVPCGLTYLHRHRFRSQALLEFGEPIVIDDEWLAAYRTDEDDATRGLTDHLQTVIGAATLTAPDWKTLRFVHAARRIYKPRGAWLTPADYVELSRRFVDRYQQVAQRPEVIKMRAGVENYQSRLDMLGIKDYQLRKPLTFGEACRKVLWRSFVMLVLLPFAIPGAILHMPVAWIAASVGSRFSYDQDDEATLKVIVVVLLLPLVYLAIAIVVGMLFGLWWGVVIGLALPLSFFASLKIIEEETNLFTSVVGILRLVRFRQEVEELRQTRAQLAREIRAIADRHADPDVPRLFTRDDFAS